MQTIDETFTKLYCDYIDALDKAQLEFDKNPNKVTATTLSNLKHKKFTREERFTPEYLNKCEIERKESDKNSKRRLQHLLNDITIERKYETGQINSQTRLSMLQDNDAKFNDVINL